MVRLKDKVKDNILECKLFQFLMVRLKVNPYVGLENYISISIPYGAIRREKDRHN